VTLRYDEGTAAGGGGGTLGTVALVWGVGGFTLLLAFAVWRLAQLAAASLAFDWHAAHWALFAGNLLFMAWVEGYRGFQQSYSPRLAARAHHLYRHATALQTLLAPLVCMGFLHAPRRRVISAFALTAGVVAIVLVYRALPQPWRGILDAGVVVGLLWGMVATLVHVGRSLREGPAVDPEFR
jgi:hypothetical protein